jgi:CheY-like chemotaxis protein
VLIVDDEPNIRFLFRVAFEAAGFLVDEAPDGQQALERVAASRPDVVTTDYMMPVMDGAVLIERLRADPATADIAVVLVSASQGARRVEGADVFLHKPFDPSLLVAEATELLEDKGTS